MRFHPRLVALLSAFCILHSALAQATFTTQSLRWQITAGGLHGEITDLETSGAYDRKNGSSQPIARVTVGGTPYSSNAATFSDPPPSLTRSARRALAPAGTWPGGQKLVTLTFATLNPSPILTLRVTPLAHAIVIQIAAWDAKGQAVTSIDFAFFGTRFGSSGAGGISTDWFWTGCGTRYWDSSDRRLLLIAPLTAANTGNGNTVYNTIDTSIAMAPEGWPLGTASAVISCAESDDAGLRTRLAEAEAFIGTRGGQHRKGYASLGSQAYRSQLFWENNYNVAWHASMLDWDLRSGVGGVLLEFPGWYDTTASGGGVNQGAWVDQDTLTTWVASHRVAGVEVGPHIWANMVPKAHVDYVNNGDGVRQGALRLAEVAKLESDLLASQTTGTVAANATLPAGWPSSGEFVVDSEVIHYVSKSGAQVTLGTRAYNQAAYGSQDHFAGADMFRVITDAATANYYELSISGGGSADHLASVAAWSRILFAAGDPLRSVVWYMDELEDSDDSLSETAPVWWAYPYCAGLFYDALGPSRCDTSNARGGALPYSFESAGGQTDYGDYVNTATFRTKLQTNLRNTRAWPITLAQQGSGAVTGHWRYRYVWTDANSVLLHSDEARVSVNSVSAVRVSGWPTGSGGTITIYRTATGPGTTYKTVTSGLAASTASYDDSVADGSLGANFSGTEVLTTIHRQVAAPVQLAWIRPDGSGVHATCDDIESALSISLATGAAITWQVRPDYLTNQPNLDFNLRLANLYEQQRLSGTDVDQSTKDARWQAGATADWMLFRAPTGAYSLVSVTLDTTLFSSNANVRGFKTAAAAVNGTQWLSAWVKAAGSDAYTCTVPTTTVGQYAVYTVTEDAGHNVSWTPVTVSQSGGNTTFTLTGRVWIDCGSLALSKFTSATLVLQ